MRKEFPGDKFSLWIYVFLFALGLGSEVGWCAAFLMGSLGYDS